jgi:hypothetical protein
MEQGQVRRRLFETVIISMILSQNISPNTPTQYIFSGLSPFFSEVILGLLKNFVNHGFSNDLLL